MKVDIFGPDGRKLQFQLTDACEPLLCRWGIDIPRTPEEEASCRRGQSVVLSEPAVADAFEKLDAAIVDAAFKNCKEWLKAKPGFDTREAIRARYKEMLFHREGDEHKCIKFKVKCPGTKHPTKLYKIEGSDYVRDGACVQDLEARGCRVSPILSCSGMWFIPGGQFGVFLQAEELGVLPGASTEGSSFTSKRANFRIVERGDVTEAEAGGVAEAEAEAEMSSA